MIITKLENEVNMYITAKGYEPSRVYLGRAEIAELNRIALQFLGRGHLSPEGNVIVWGNLGVWPVSTDTHIYVC
jgi:hypothetical protein